MASTTHSEFGHDTEAVDVAKAFADGIRGKTVLITGVNHDGIGFSTAHAFVSVLNSNLYQNLTSLSPPNLRPVSSLPAAVHPKLRIALMN